MQKLQRGRSGLLGKNPCVNRPRGGSGAAGEISRGHNSGAGRLAGRPSQAVRLRPAGGM